MNKLTCLTILLFSFLLNATGQIGFLNHDILDNSKYSYAISVDAIDMDGDGDLDFITSNASRKSLLWYENLDGSGTFSGYREIILQSRNKGKIFVADMEPDGDSDIVTIENDGTYLYRNFGNGTFDEGILITSTVFDVIELVDLDSDGHTDIVSIEDWPKSLTWYKYNGDGSFEDANIIDPTVYDVQELTIGDLNNDGHPDICVGYDNKNEIVRYESIDGMGNFIEKDTIFIPGESVKSLWLDDVDGDSYKDIIVISLTDPEEIYFGHQIIWYKNLEGGNDFGPGQIISDIVVSNPFARTFDLDGDGDLDLITNADSVSYYINLDGLGNFGPKQRIDDGFNAYSILAADIDNDNKIDIGYTASGPRLVWHKGIDGLGTFGSQIIVPPVSVERALQAVDIDNDHDLDIVYQTIFNDLFWQENLDGKGTFGKQKLIEKDIDLTQTPIPIDFDNDGDKDLVLNQGNAIGWLENLDGEGNFRYIELVRNDFYDMYNLHVEDVDFDGDYDILFRVYSIITLTPVLNWYENHGGAQDFTSREKYTLEPGTRYVKLVDIDLDEELDIFTVANWDTYKWRKNYGGFEGFSSYKDILSDFKYHSVRFADIDLDSDMDILIVDQAGKKLYVLRNLDGKGTFASPALVLENELFWNSTVLFDMDLDQDLDICNISAETFSWYENASGHGDFEHVGTQENEYDLHKNLIVADINDDGYLDLLVLRGQYQEISWIENLGPLSNKINGKIQYEPNDIICSTNSMGVADLMVVHQNENYTFSTLSMSDGTYKANLNQGDFKSYIMHMFPDYYNIEPEMYENNFTDLNNTVISDFCITPSMEVNDLQITLLPTNEARSGFNGMYQLVLKNVGTTVLDANIQLKFQIANLDFLSSDVVADVMNDELRFNFSELAPFSCTTINLTFKILAPPITELGDTLKFKASVESGFDDITPEDNVFELDQEVIGSYDPNDIRVLEGPCLLIDEVDEFLHYIIRFQNTGTAEAIHIRVENELDDLLDWETFTPINTSHMNRTFIEDGKIVSFVFNNIYLPDSTHNEPESHGFISYKIKLKEGAKIGDAFSNYADIFFDYNLPIRTNTVQTKIVDKQDSSCFNQPSEPSPPGVEFSISPNPSSNRIQLDSNQEIQNVEIINCLGQLVLTKQGQVSIDISSLEDGIYLCLIYTKSGTYTIEKFMKI